MVLTKSAQKLNKGNKAPDFKLKGVDEKEYSLKDFENKQGLLVIFMCNHCPYVKAKVPAILNLFEKLGDRVSFVGINSNDPEYEGEGMENMKLFAKEQGIKFPYLLDDTQEVAKTYGATCTPDPFLFAELRSSHASAKASAFDKDLKLVFHGRLDDAMGPGEVAKEHTMEENISKMLSGQAISDEFKPSIGCSIKWKGE